MLFSCRHDDEIFIPEEVEVSTPEFTAIQGFYLLNEGNMGTNKATLDFYDYTTGIYTRNIYGNANPEVPKELGDVGNDLAIYGNRLYAVINVSNKVEVMDAKSAKRIGQIEIPNCRYIKFHDKYAYVTSYAGPVIVGSEHSQIGYVAKVDTATLQIVDKCLVGYQPDGIEIMDNKIYVANSGGYLSPNYERTVSVIDLSSFTKIKDIDVGLNLNLLAGDKHGNLWISSRGDYLNESSKLYCYDVRKERMVNTFDIPVANMQLCGDSLYVISAPWGKITSTVTVNYLVINVLNHAIEPNEFINAEVAPSIKTPYGISVNPITKDIYLTDAKTYVNPGNLYSFDSKGNLKWSVRTGDIPAHIAFLGN